MHKKNLVKNNLQQQAGATVCKTACFKSTMIIMNNRPHVMLRRQVNRSGRRMGRIGMHILTNKLPNLMS